jgi:DNA replication protein DnaC
VVRLIEIEEEERKRRGLDRRIRSSKVGRFKTMADFDWAWPSEIDREQIEELLTLGFMKDAVNIVLVGPNGIGKTMVAQNITHRALVAGHTALCVTASQMLTDLGSQETSTALQKRLRRYVRPNLLVVDEVGYLSYDDRAGDLFFEVVSHRHQHKPIVITTNKAFKQWNDVFPSSSCVTALVDRIMHKAEIVRIEGKSYRAKEAMERAEQRAKERQKVKARRAARRAGE